MWWALEVETAERLRADLVWERKAYISKVLSCSQESATVVWHGPWSDSPSGNSNSATEQLGEGPEQLDE